MLKGVHNASRKLILELEGWVHPSDWLCTDTAYVSADSQPVTHQPISSDPTEGQTHKNATLWRSVDAKINIYILSIFLKVQNFLITLTVISAPSVLSTWKNLPLKLTIYENDAVTSWA